MFIGLINADLRSILAGLVPAWRGLPVFVGCSGNFTVERILAAQGLNDLYGNDVSLYSCPGLQVAEGDTYYAGTFRQNEEAAIARLKGEDPEEEMEFPVVRRTVTIRPKPE